MLDRYSQTTCVISAAQGAHTATVTGGSVDTAGYDSATVYLLPGVITDGTHLPKVQESVDNSTWTDVAATDLMGTPFSNLASNVNQKMGYVGIKRYLRIVSTVAGATTGGIYAGIIILGMSKKLPQVA
jgi:hypothetical protein